MANTKIGVKEVSKKRQSINTMNTENCLENLGVYIPSLVYFLKHQAKASVAYENAIDAKDAHVIDGIEATITYCVNAMLKTKIDMRGLKRFIRLYQNAKVGQVIKLNKRYYLVKKAMPTKKEYNKPNLPTDTDFKEAP